MWTLKKWGVGILGKITSGTIDPGGWMGGTCAEIFKQDRYQFLNLTNEDLSDREANLRLIQLVDSYQNASVGGHVTRTVGKLITEENKLKVFLDSGIDWAQGKIKQKGLEILFSSGLTQVTLEKLQIKNGFKNPLGLNIVFHYLVLTEKAANSEAKEWAKEFIDCVLLHPWFTDQNENKNEVEVIIETLKIHEENISCMLRLNDLIVAERKLIWQMNEENVGLYIETESNWDKHCKANDLVNSCLRRLRRVGGGSSTPSGIEMRLEMQNEDYLSFLNRLERSLPEHERNSKRKDKMERILIRCTSSVEKKVKEKQQRQERLLQQERERLRQQEQERIRQEEKQELERERRQQRQEYQRRFTYQTQPRQFF